VYFRKKVANVWGLGSVGARVLEIRKNKIEIESEEKMTL
jgi:hypothetical protein